MKNYTYKLLIGLVLLLPVRGIGQTVYTGQQLNRIAYPIGGLGAGMFCLEGGGRITAISINHNPALSNDPNVFAAISLKGHPELTRVLEGPVSPWKISGADDSGEGSPGKDWGLPRFRQASFEARFPFAKVKLQDPAIPLRVSISAWSPFIPNDEDNSSLPAGALEYHFENTGQMTREYVFSFNSQKILDHIQPFPNGFQFNDTGEQPRSLAIFVSGEGPVKVDHSWFQGGWYDPLTMLWRKIRQGDTSSRPVMKDAPGASLFLPFKLKPGEGKTIKVLLVWYVPNSRARIGQWPVPDPNEPVLLPGYRPQEYYQPWYASKFHNLGEMAQYFRDNYSILKQRTEEFTNCFYKSTLPKAVLDAVSANLSILKSPTILRQYDGRLWGWEGSKLFGGSCPGSCTHVWNYAQSIPHLFPRLERTLRITEFNENQDSTGKQSFRAALPIRKTNPIFYAAADGQLGGIIKIYRDWRISGDDQWLKALYPKIKRSLEYCIEAWDPKHTGLLEEPHHNTYDIEFWGAEPMCSLIYLQALQAMVQISDYLGKPENSYRDLLSKGKTAMENQLYNGQYFFQQTNWKGLQAGDPLEMAKKSFFLNYSGDALTIYKKEGPKYQYGTGCLSDGVIGAWMAETAGLPQVIDWQKVRSHLNAVYRYNFKKDLSGHANPQRSTYALGNEGGLLLCTWPKGQMPSLPFVYSNEVWTGIEYQVAAHLIMNHEVVKGLQIVKTARERYNGTVRNPFDEFECGHWYARAMSSYSLLQALTGLRYDAVNKTLYVDSRTGDFTTFLSTESGFGNVTFGKGTVAVKMATGHLEIKKVIVSGKAISKKNYTIS